MLEKQGRHKTRKIDKTTLCLGDVLDSRAVVGRGERTLVPGHVRKAGHYVGLQGVQSVLVGPFDDSLADFKKMIV